MPQHYQPNNGFGGFNSQGPSRNGSPQERKFDDKGRL